MNKTFRAFKTLSSASMKMYFRNRGAVFFSLVFPLVLLAVFGFLSKSNTASVKIDYTDYAKNQFSQTFVDSIKKVEAFKITETDENEANTTLGKGDIDLQIIIPSSFGSKASNGSTAPATIETRYNAAHPANGQAANLIITQIASAINADLAHTPQIISVNSQGVSSNNLGYFDFILPGLLAMVIMQAGLFGVAFAFVSYKASGALRRLQATPIHPRVFIMAQAVTRLAVTLLTVVILIGFGIKFFSFHMIGSYWEFAVVTILGILIFLGFGFAVAGYSKDENQVAPLANIIQLPMLFLSGIFFPREVFPAWLKHITDFFPLTYLSDAMRHVANEGLHLTQIKGDLLGMLVWIVVIFFVAINVFRWE